MQGLITLLARFPKYSARKVRRLAKQLDMLQNLDPLAYPDYHGICEDLMEFNIMQAERQERESEGDIADVEPSCPPPGFEVRPIPTERTMTRVVPLDEAIKIIETAYPVEFTTEVISKMNEASFMTTEKIDVRHDPST